MDRLFEGVEVSTRRGDAGAVEVTALALDSREVTPGALFFCLPGERADGHDFAGRAVAAGAVGLLVERPLAETVPQMVVPAGTARRAMAEVAAAFYDHPAAALRTVGVTGTNGKTTVTHLVDAILESSGVGCAVIGTLDGARTTPEAPELQRILAEARDGGKRAAALEVSSHALTQHRVDGIRFDAAVFTNLSHDHLDFHGTMERYYEAKASLFTAERAAVAVVSTDDAWGRRLAAEVDIPVVTFGGGDASEVRSTPGATTFRWRGRPVRLPLTGAYHVANAVAAATAAVVLGLDEDAVVRGLASAAPVVGRFETVPVEAGFTVVVDYAHTPDGLAVALDSARRLAGPGRVICVFGAGGDRDRSKRPEMGAVVSAAADVTVVTSDNPRHEDPVAIIDEIVAGVVAGAAVVVAPDRAEAIGRAVAAAAGGDVVLIAGKGHETVIEMGDERRPFDDRAVATAAVAALGVAR